MNARRFQEVYDDILEKCRRVAQGLPCCELEYSPFADQIEDNAELKRRNEAFETQSKEDRATIEGQKKWIALLESRMALVEKHRL